VVIRVAGAGAAELHRRIGLKPVVRGFKRVLPGEDERWLDPAAAQGARDGRELDRFGTGPDCDCNWIWQPSP
jgi:hypothetical protein